MNSISSLLNDIISKGTDNPSQNVVPEANRSFDKEAAKEKLAFGIIKDMTKAMMNDDTPKDESMLDNSILDHIHNDYKGTCFGYLNDAKNRLKSPLFESMIEAIEEAVIQEEADFEDKGYVADNHKISEDILDGNPDYQTFRDKLAKETSNMVVNDVAGELLKSNQTPDFSNIDNKIKGVSEDPNTEPPAEEAELTGGEAPTGEEPVTEEEQELPTAPTEEYNASLNESAILNMTQTIVTESFVNGKPMTTEDGMEKAICEFCVQQLCFLVKDTSRSPFDKYLK
jgi:hypothetical protein